MKSNALPLVALVMLIAGGCQRELMKTPTLYTMEGVAAFKDVPPELQHSEVVLFYATDRVPGTDDPNDPQYGYERSPSLAIGETTVTIGDNVDWDTLVQESVRKSRKTKLKMEVTKINEHGRFPATPSPVKIVNEQRLPTDEWLQEYAAVESQLHDHLRRRLSQTPCKEAFVYIHGFDNEFDDAAITWAETWHFLARKGVPIIYTWPAGRQLSGRGYVYDRESGSFTVFHLRQFLRSLAACPQLEKIHLLAHSRGTAVLTTALRELHLELSGDDGVHDASLKLGHVVLAAADLNFAVAQQRLAAEHLSGMVEWMTVYASGGDKALKFADILSFGEFRLGQAEIEDYPPDVREMIEAMPNVGLVYVKEHTGGTGHSYFHSNPDVSSDLVLLLRDNRLPGADHGRPLKPLAHSFWELDKDYPHSLPTP